ncbi:TonB-dependent receptor [bacterium]|nr:TonB-dependent receptor [bacterium]
MLYQFVRLLLFVILLPAALPAQGQDLTEESLFQPLRSAVTASGADQSLDQSPASMTVISAQEIRASGAGSIPELLQWVPGLDVMRLGASQYEVCARGLNMVPADKMLVLIDGRSVYQDYFGGINWFSLPLLPEQIERIEVMRSPGSALYGANAFSGVINIITRTPSQLNGVRLEQRLGSHGRAGSSLLAGGQRGQTGYRIAAGYRGLDSFSQPRRHASRNALGSLLLERQLTDRTSLSLDAGLAGGYADRIFLEQMQRQRDNNSHLKLNLDRNDLACQLYLNHGEMHQSTYSPGEGSESVRYNTLDLELQNGFHPTMRDHVIYGLEARLNTIRSNILDRSRRQGLLAAYIQDEYRPLPEISFLAGARLDHHPLTGLSASPRLNVLYSPAPSHIFRLTYNRAFRSPSFINSYLDYSTAEGIRLLGNRELDSERINSLEAGYVWSRRERLKVKLDLFALTLSGNIAFSDVLQVVDASLADSYRNFGTARGCGGELTIDYLPVRPVKIVASYSYQRLHNRFSARRSQHTPRHKGSLQLYATLPAGLSLFGAAGYVGPSVWEVPAGLGLTAVSRTGQFVRLSGRIGYELPRGGLTLFVAGDNLAGPSREQYPLGEYIERQFDCGVQWEF